MNALPLIAILILTAEPQLTESAAPALTPTRETPAVKAARLVLPMTVRLSLQAGGRRHGSGVVVHADGYILTAYHIVATAAKIRVTLADGTELEGNVFAHDAENDFALLKVAPAKPLEAITWGKSANVLPAETVLALGNSYGRGTIVTQGVISTTDATADLPDGSKFAHVLQTDASVHVGMSGGPLVNLDGELIGLNLFVRADEADIAYSLPTDRMREKVNEWLKGAKQEGK